MTREEHNRKFGVNRRPDEKVILRLGGGEESQYDSMCAACYVGRPHTWREHDAYVEFRRDQLRQWGRSLAKKGLPLPPPAVVQGFDYLQEGYEELKEIAR